MFRILFSLLVIISTLISVEFLMPEEAFKPRITMADSQTIAIDIDLGESIYLYKDKLLIEDMNKKDGIEFKKISMASTIDHEGVAVFEKSPAIRIRLAKTEVINGDKKVKVKLTYQGCSSAGLCYEPQEAVLEINVDMDQLESAKGEKQPEVIKAEPIKEELQPIVQQEENSNQAWTQSSSSETDQIANVIKGGSLWVIVASFFGFGLLLSLTPCVFPMIPIISSVIMAQGGGLGAKKAFLLSLVYVLSMAIAYTIAGVLAGLFGANLQSALQSPWIITLFSLLFVTLALSMFDVYELQVPNFIQSRITRISGQKGGIIGIAIMGFLSALIVGPCVAAPLAGALIYIGQTGDALLGGVALFSLSIGMGIPLLAVGTTSGKFMPKPGMWMDTVKSMFGVMLLGIAVWMMSRILDESIVLILWGILGVFVAVNLGAFDSMKDEKSWGIARNAKALGLIIFLYAALLMFGGMVGAKSVLEPLAPLTKTSSYQSKEEEPAFTKIKSLEELNTIVTENKGKKIMIDFYADWCTSCKEYEEKTFSDTAVKNELKKFVLVKVDVTENDDTSKAITKKFGIFGPPAILFYDQNGALLENKTIIGFKEAREFISHVGNI